MSAQLLHGALLSQKAVDAILSALDIAQTQGDLFLLDEDEEEKTETVSISKTARTQIERALGLMQGFSEKDIVKTAAYLTESKNYRSNQEGEGKNPRVGELVKIQYKKSPPKPWTDTNAHFRIWKQKLALEVGEVIAEHYYGINTGRHFLCNETIMIRPIDNGVIISFHEPPT